MAAIFLKQDMLVFPEITDKEEYDDMNAMLDPIYRFFLESGKLYLCLICLNSVIILMMQYSFMMEIEVLSFFDLIKLVKTFDVNIFFVFCLL